MKGLFDALEDLTWLIQLGLSMMMPLLLCMGGTWWAVTRWGWPSWVYIIAIILGLGAGAQTFASYARHMQRRAAKKKPEDRIGFNSHE